MPSDSTLLLVLRLDLYNILTNETLNIFETFKILKNVKLESCNFLNLCQGCEKIKHTVQVATCSEYDKARYSDQPACLIQMFDDHEDIIINNNEVCGVVTSSNG